MANESDRLSLLLNIRRYAEGEKTAREVIGQYPGWADGYTYLALFLVYLGRGAEALGPAREAVRHSPHSPWVHASLAWVHLKIRDYPAARDAAREAVRLDPTYPYGLSLLAEAHYRLDDFKTCREVAAEGLRHNPTHESLLHWKGFADYKQSRLAPAEEAARLGLNHHPQSARLLNLLGCVLQERAEKAGWPGRRLRLHREADVAFRYCLRNDPASQDYQDNRRRNARSCRKFLLTSVVGSVFAVFVVLGGALSRRVDQTGAAGGLGLLALIAGTLTLALFLEKSPVFALAAPFPGRFRLPTIPLDAREARTGRCQWWVAGPVWLAAVGTSGTLLVWMVFTASG
jgi:tetratricopeptide (TPR) repeat protein